MYICFVEYQIDPSAEGKYRNWIADRLPADNRLKLYEGTDQPLLFVEVWEAEDEQQALNIKEERCSERSSWHEMAAWVPGGSLKIHAWTFKPFSGRGER